MSESACNCDDSLELRAELAIVKRERDYLAGMASAEDLRVMRKELATGWEPDAATPELDDA